MFYFTTSEYQTVQHCYNTRACVYIYLCVCVLRLPLYVYTHTHSRTKTCTHTHVHTYKNIHIIIMYILYGVGHFVRIAHRQRHPFPITADLSLLAYMYVPTYTDIPNVHTHIHTRNRMHNNNIFQLFLYLGPRGSN